MPDTFSRTFSLWTNAPGRISTLRDFRYSRRSLKPAEQQNFCTPEIRASPPDGVRIRYETGLMVISGVNHPIVSGIEQKTVVSLWKTPAQRVLCEGRPLSGRDICPEGYHMPVLRYGRDIRNPGEVTPGNQPAVSDAEVLVEVTTDHGGCKECEGYQSVGINIHLYISYRLLSVCLFPGQVCPAIFWRRPSRMP